jgi:hypothetical protein
MAIRVNRATDYGTFDDTLLDRVDAVFAGENLLQVILTGTIAGTLQSS